MPLVDMNWTDIGDRVGLPEEWEPTPFPFPPLPKWPLYKLNGLGSYKAYALVNSTLEYLGTVWGTDEGEAIEAGENLAEVEEIPFTAIEVIRG